MNALVLSSWEIAKVSKLIPAHAHFVKAKPVVMPEWTVAAVKIAPDPVNPGHVICVVFIFARSFHFLNFGRKKLSALCCDRGNISGWSTALTRSSSMPTRSGGAPHVVMLFSPR